jgi:hypothetical protein
MFLPNVKAGLSNIRQSLVNDGRFAAAVWASPDKVPFISFPLDILMKETNIPLPPSANSPGPFSLSNEDLLRDSFVNSGFKDVITEKQNMVFDFESAEAFTNCICETASPVQVVLSNQSEEKRKQLLKTITKAANKYADKNSGNVRFNNEVICIVGKK